MRVMGLVYCAESEIKSFLVMFLPADTPCEIRDRANPSIHITFRLVSMSIKY